MGSRCGLILSLMLVSPFFMAAGCETQTTWRELSPLPVGVCGHIAGVCDDKLYVAGGTNWTNGQKFWLSDAYEYVFANNTWIKSSHSLPVPNAYSVYGSADGKLFYAGGENSSSAYAKVFELKIRDGAVLQICNLPQPISLAGGTFADGNLYIIGGQVSTGTSKHLTGDFLKIDVAAKRVKKLKPYPAGQIMLSAVAAANGEIFVFGGAKISPSSATVNENGAFAYSFKQRKWRKLAPFPSARRGLSACAIDDEWIFVGGGYGELKIGKEGFSDEAFLYSVKDDKYYPLSPLPYAVLRPGIIKYGEKLYIFGGEDAMKHRAAYLYECDWRKMIKSIPQKSGKK